MKIITHNIKAILLSFSVCYVIYLMRVVLRGDVVDKVKDLSLNPNCDRDAILCGIQTVEKLHMEKVKSNLYKLVTTRTFSCTTRERFGRSGDGGYEVCMLDKLAPDKTNCLVYSFGIRDDWSFDEHMSRYGCEVHSFDPSILFEDHIHPPNVSFHKLGLWGDDYNNSYNWQLNRLSTIRRKLGHLSRTIDIVKLDVEIAEWPFMRDVTVKDRHSMDMVKQLIIEYHTPVFKNETLTTEHLLEVTHYVTMLKALGFELFQFNDKNYCCGKFAGWMPATTRERCCIESFYVNKRI